MTRLSGDRCVGFRPCAVVERRLRSAEPDSRAEMPNYHQELLAVTGFSVSCVQKQSREAISHSFLTRLTGNRCFHILFFSLNASRVALLRNVLRRRVVASLDEGKLISTGTRGATHSA